MENEIKILLTSDLHIGAGDEGSPLSDSFRLMTLKKIINTALKHDILLIAGDLIQADGISEQSLTMVQEELKAGLEKGLIILFTPGSYDLINNSELHPGLARIGFTRIFYENFSREPYCFTKGNETIQISGSNMDIDAIKTASMSTNNKLFHIALLYSQFESCVQKSHNDIPAINKSDLRQMNCDFYALGSYHHFRVFKSGGKIIGVYPGTPEPCSLDETGDRFVLSFSVKNNNVTTVKRLVVNTSSVISREIDCSDPEALAIMMKISTTEKSHSVFLNLNLIGTRCFDLDTEHLFKSSDWCGLNINDRSEPAPILNINRYSGEESFRGEFLREILPQLLAGNTGLPADEIYSVLFAMVDNNMEYLEEMFCSFKNA